MWLLSIKTNSMRPKCMMKYSFEKSQKIWLNLLTVHHKWCPTQNSRLEFLQLFHISRSFFLYQKPTKIPFQWFIFGNNLISHSSLLFAEFLWSSLQIETLCIPYLYKKFLLTNQFTTICFQIIKLLSRSIDNDQK